MERQQRIDPLELIGLAAKWAREYSHCEGRNCQNCEFGRKKQIMDEGGEVDACELLCAVLLVVHGE